jgi:hypothetical protein
MKIVYEYSHLGGSEILQVRYPEINRDIYAVIDSVRAKKDKLSFNDMAKFQYFFNESQADVGVEIVPCHNLQSKMSSGVSYGEQLVYDIERLKRHFPAVSVKIIFIDVDDELFDDQSPIEV